MQSKNDHDRVALLSNNCNNYKYDQKNVQRTWIGFKIIFLEIHFMILV